MTAPRAVCRNTKKALAERGPSIHDGDACCGGLRLAFWKTVIASVAKQSMAALGELWIASSLSSSHDGDACGGGLRLAANPPYGLRAKSNFWKQFKLIWVVQSFPQKYCALPVGQIISTSPRRLVSQEGRLAIVTKRGAGCGGHFWRL